MNLKALIITNLFPIVQHPISGIFIVKRLQQYKKFNVSYTAVSIGFKDDYFLRVLKKFLKKPESGIPSKMYENVEFIPILIERNIFSVFKNKIFPDRYEELVKQYVKGIPLEMSIRDFDVIHAHGMYHLPAGTIAEKLAEEYNKPFLITVHGSDINLVMPKRYKRYVNTFEKASKVIFVSKALLDKAKSFGYSGKNAVVIPNGYDKEIFKVMDKNEVRKELGVYKEQFKYVGFVGNLVPIKRADKLSEIFHLIAQEIPNTFFMVVGDGILRKKMEKEMKDLKVLFTGRIPQEEVAKYMNAMDVMVLPSRAEGFGAVIIEAQACGTCVIGSGNGGIPEAIGFEEYVIEEGKDFERRFSQKVVEMLKKGYDSRRLIERAKDFTWDAVVKKEIDVYKKAKDNYSA